MLPTSSGGPVCALPLHACTSVTPRVAARTLWPRQARGQQCADQPLRVPTYTMNPTPPDPKWHPPNGVKDPRRDRVADASQRAPDRKASAERKEIPARRGAHSRPLNAGRRTTSVAAVAALCCCMVRKVPWTQVHPADLAGGERCRRDSAAACGLGPPLPRPGKVVAIRLSYPSETKGCRPDVATTPQALRLTILPPGLPPNGTGLRMAAVSRARAEEPVREAMVEIFPPDWNCPASARQRHTGSDLGFCLRVEHQTFSLHRKRSSDR